MTIIIAKNNTGSAIMIDDLGFEIPGSGQRTLTDTFDKYEIGVSSNLKNYVSSGDIIINDGTIDLSISDGLKHIDFETDYEDINTIDIYQDGVFIGATTKINFNGAVVYDSTSGLDVVITPVLEEIKSASVQIRRTTGLEIPTSWVDLTFDTTDIETDPDIIEHDTVNTDRIIIKETGLYEISTNTTVRTTTTTKSVFYRIRVNDSTVIPSSVFEVDLYQDETHEISRNLFVELNENDFVTFQFYRENANGLSTLLTNASMLVRSLNAIKGKDGIDGDPGIPGPPGTGSTINVSKAGILVGSLIENINFTGSANVTLDSTSTVNVEIVGGAVDVKKDGTTISSAISSINFTGPVSVTEPTSKNVKVDIIFGSNFQEASSDSASTTTSTSYQQKLRMTTPSLPSGAYRIGWYYESQHRDDRDDFMGRVQINDTTTIMEHQLEFKDNGSDQWEPISGFYYHTGDGILNIDIDYASSVNAKTSSIRRARLEIWRVS